MAVVEEVNDEVDDTLEDYSEGLIIRALSVNLSSGIFTLTI